MYRNSPFTLKPHNTQLLPSDDDVTFYRQHGWYLSKRLFTDEELNALLEASERFYAGHRDRVLPKKPGRAAYWEPSHGDVQRHNDYICYESHIIRMITCKPLIGAIAAQLMDTTEARLWSSTLIYKPHRPDETTNIVPWHIDRHHWQTCTSDNLITAFIPLHPCGTDNGTLVVTDGSHLWQELPPTQDDDSTLHFAERPRHALDHALTENARYNGAPIIKIPLKIEKGHVSFHHCRTYHASGPNLSRSPRRVITVRFQEKDNHWRAFHRTDGRLASYSHDSLVRKTNDGTPDYSDPEFCPVVWRI